LDHVGVQKWIERIRQQRRKADAAPPEEVLAYLTAIMRGNPIELERTRDEGGGLKDLCDIDPETTLALIAGVKSKTRFIQNGDGDPITEHTIEYKLVDRLKAAQLLAEHHGLLGDPKKRHKLVKETKAVLGGISDRSDAPG
jgi:hypothetical protein